MMKPVVAFLLAFVIACYVAPVLAQDNDAPARCSSADIVSRMDGVISTYNDMRATLKPDDVQAAFTLAELMQSNFGSLTNDCRGAFRTAAGEGEYDGSSAEKALPLGEEALMMQGQGTVKIVRVVRGATSATAPFLAYQVAGTGKEWLMLWVTFTCKKSLCDRMQDDKFFLVGDQKLVYSNFHYVDGSQFPDQLAGQAMNGGEISGWLWFKVPKDEANLALSDDYNDSQYLSLTRLSLNAQTVTVSAPGTVNLRGCAGTQCAVIGRANSGDQLILIEDQGDWLHIRTPDGTEGFISASLVQK